VTAASASPAAAAPSTASRSAAAALEAHAVEEDHGFGAFARHRQRRHGGDAEGTEGAGCTAGLRFQFALHVPAVAAHPEHHLQDQARGEQHHAHLEYFKGLAFELALRGKSGETEHHRQSESGRHTRPEPAPQRRRLRLAGDPGQQHADHQHGFEAFAKDDDQGVEHGVLLRNKLHRAGGGMELVDEAIAAGLQRMDH
jgi:hypothetical protein